jgi:hypothetical protein
MKTFVLVFVGMTLSVPGLKLSGQSTGSEFMEEGRHKT